MLTKGYLYHLVRVNNLEHEVLSIDSTSVVNEFQDVFPEDLAGIHPAGKINFGIDLDPNTKKFTLLPI